MSIKHSFFLSQALFLLLVLGALVIGDHSHPRLIGVPTHLDVTKPIIVTFDRPVQHDHIEQHFTFTKNGENVRGSYSWSSRSFAFTPEEPLDYDTDYSLHVSDVKDMEGHSLPSSYNAQLKTNDPRFLFITSAGELYLENVKQRQGTSLSLVNEQVTQFSVATNSSRVAYVYTEKNHPERSGLKDITFDEVGNIISVKIIYQGNTKEYQNIQFCNNDENLIANVTNVDANGLIPDSGIVSFSLVHGIQFGKEKELLDGNDIAGSNILACSRHNDQFFYQDGKGKGNIVLTSISNPTQEESIGIYDVSYGFSPQGDAILMEKTASFDQEQLSAIYAINSVGEKTTLSESNLNSTNVAYDTKENRWAITAYEPNTDILDPYSHSQIFLYQRDGGNTFQKFVLTPRSDDFSYEQAAWSADSHYLTYKKVALLPGMDNSQDFDEYSLPGDIELVEFSSKDHLPPQYTTDDLGIQGSNMYWLP